MGGLYLYHIKTHSSRVNRCKMGLRGEERHRGAMLITVLGLIPGNPVQ